MGQRARVLRLHAARPYELGHGPTIARRARTRPTVARRRPAVPGVLPVLRLARRGMAGVAPRGLAAGAVVPAALRRLRAGAVRAALSGGRPARTDGPGIPCRTDRARPVASARRVTCRTVPTDHSPGWAHGAWPDPFRLVPSQRWPARRMRLGGPCGEWPSAWRTSQRYSERSSRPRLVCGWNNSVVMS